MNKLSTRTINKSPEHALRTLRIVVGFSVLAFKFALNRISRLCLPVAKEIGPCPEGGRTGTRPPFEPLGPSLSQRDPRTVNKNLGASGSGRNQGVQGPWPARSALDRHVMPPARCWAQGRS
jgi:hypothetical protein